MASLAIRKLKYIGTRYEYESPELGDGLVILEGSNGSGKSTFANLIYFGLGGRVDEFRSDSTEKHVEIVGDEGNYVELRIAIDQSEFLLKRFIGQNDIAVSNGESVELLPLTRGEGREFIFSDWMLKQLDIEPVLLQFATYSGKISFTDLCRLIYHDQAPDPSGIFRAVDNNSFVSDSRVFRRAIFELLIGKRYQSYYSTLAQFRLADQERNKANHALELFSEMSDGLVISDSDTTERTQAELKDLRGQATRLLQYRGELAKAPPPQDSESDLAITQQKYVEAELELAQIARAEAFLLDEAADIERLKADLIVEATQIKKMMFANEKLALFDADTCPYCLHPVQRVEGQCICGREVQGGEFVKFFYNEQEYATILKSKQKNVET